MNIQQTMLQMAPWVQESGDERLWKHKSPRCWFRAPGCSSQILYSYNPGNLCTFHQGSNPRKPPRMDHRIWKCGAGTSKLPQFSHWKRDSMFPMQDASRHGAVGLKREYDS